MTLTRLSRNDSLYRQLADIVGEKSLHLDGEVYQTCSTDATEIKCTPLAVVTITDSKQLPPLFRLASANNIPIIARGAGTGYTGGAVAECGGIVVSLSELNRIIEIDKQAKTAIVEPGVITQALADAAASDGLFYPPDPASVKESSIGGNVAECAGGLRCKKYGLTKDYVLGLEGYDIEGELIQTGVFAKDEVYDLGSILVGSEGTLVFITRIAVQLIDPPSHRQTLFATFGDQTSAAKVVAEIMASGVIPAVLEFMDGDAVACSLNYLGLKETIPAQAALLIEVDGTEPDVVSQSNIVIPIIRQHSPLQFEETNDANRRDYLWTLRRSISRAVTAAAVLRVSEDVCVPPSRLPALVASLPDLAAKYDVRINSFGHAGDGNLHVNFLVQSDDEATRKRLHDAVIELFRLTVSMDGTISGEHGIGITKRPYLPIEVAPNTMELFRRIKSAFDPPNLVNPGKIF